MSGVSERYRSWLDRLVREELVTCAGLVVTDGRTVLGEAYAGARTPGGTAADRNTLFDLASLSKPWTATLALTLDRAGEVPLAMPVGEVWPGMPSALGRRSLEDLLRHRAGLRPWWPLYGSEVEGDDALVRLALRPPLGARAPTYSDLDYLLWAETALRVLGRRSLFHLLRGRVLQPLGTRTVVQTPRRPRAAVSSLGTGREVQLASAEGIEVEDQGPPPAGRPQDGNARFLGGYRGHAGLFATARDLAGLGGVWLAGTSPLTPSDVRRALAGTGRWALGWERTRRRGSGGASLSSEAFGHVGFTGGSLWVDPERGRVFVLAAHRSRLDVDLAPVRRAFHRLATAEA